MGNNLNTEEPAVVPAEPTVVPKPDRTKPLTKPRRDDPWEFPKPKVNPTPKG